MVRLSITETPGGAWRVDVHPSDKFNLDQDYTFERKRDALQKAKDVLEEWIFELDDC